MKYSDEQRIIKIYENAVKLFASGLYDGGKRNI